MKLAAYIRVSRVGERDEDRLRSPDWQRETIARTAQAEGHEVAWYEPELDVSGSKTSRPILDAILADLRAGRVEGIIVAKLDRLSRMKPRDRVALFEDVEGLGGIILSASEQLDPSTPEGRFARDVFLGVARMQWEKYAEGFERAKVGAMERGATIGPTPFGYRRTADGALEPDPVDGPALTEAFRRAAREGLHSAHVFLVEHGGRTWTVSTVRRLLGKRSYLGEFRYGTLRTSIPPLVDRRTWEAAQPEPAAYRKPKATFPMSGLARCAGCGRSMVGARSGRDARRMYRCSSALATSRGECPAPAGVTAALLEELTVSTLLEALSGHPGYQGGIDAGLALGEAEEALEAAEAELADLTGDLGLRRALGADRFRAMVEAAAAAVEEAQDRYRDAAREVEGQSRVPASDVLAEAGLEELGGLLRGALDAVVVTKGRGALVDRVSIVPKGAPGGAGVAAAQ